MREHMTASVTQHNAAAIDRMRAVHATGDMERPTHTGLTLARNHRRIARVYRPRGRVVPPPPGSAPTTAGVQGIRSIRILTPTRGAGLAVAIQPPGGRCVALPTTRKRRPAPAARTAPLRSPSAAAAREAKASRVGFEPTTKGLKVPCSAAELPARGQGT